MPMAKTNTQAAETAAATAVFTREQLAASKRYANRRDLINALLEADKAYTLEQVDAAIEKYLKGKVR